MSVKQRLKEFISYKEMSDRQFSLSIGVSGGYVNSISKSIQPDKINSISAQYPELDTGWLLTGEGEMLKTGPQKAGSQQSSEMVAMPREVLDLLLSQQRTMEMQQKTVEAQQRITESQQGNFAKLTEAVLAQQQTISELSKKGATADNAMVAVG